MKRILIIGSAGAGKTEFSKKLAYQLKLNLVHLDHLYWLENWQYRNKEEFIADLKSHLEKDSWILDGNYNNTIPLRLEYADTVIHLNFNRWICFYRALKRSFLKETFQARGCPQKFDWGFLWYILYQYPKQHKPKCKHYKEHLKNIEWIEIKTPKQAEDFLNNLDK